MTRIAAMPTLRGRMTVGARIVRARPGSWRLSVPAQMPGSKARYQVAQLDDYAGQVRTAFPWRAPASLELVARVSAADLPGTWGFGWWNDPFSVDIGMGGGGRRFPALPNAIWFIHAPPPNHLALHDGHPAAGFLAGVFSTPRLPWPLLALSVPALPLLWFAPAARVFRRVGQRFVREDAVKVEVDPTVEHRYRIEWTAQAVQFMVDGEIVLRTSVVPNGPLGAVLWIDNQYMAFPPDGRVRFGALIHPGGWLDLGDLVMA